MERWIQTRTGKKIYPLNPDPEDIDIRDIAHALAMTCRFCGHSREFYSVAQHSCLVASLAGAGGEGEDFKKWALLHDAAEAYLPDVARPIKPHLNGFSKIEHNLMQVIALKFDLSWPEPEDLKDYDTAILKAEAMALMDKDLDGWRVAQLDSPEPEGVRIVPVNPIVARKMFLNRFEMYFGSIDRFNY